jgi:uncharacterized membrane protein YkoI
LTSEEHRVKDATVAKEIALRTCRDIGWAYPSERDIKSITLSDDVWNVKIKYYDETIEISINARTGDVINFKRF